MAPCLQEDDAVKATKEEEADARYMDEEGEEYEFSGDLGRNENGDEEDNEVPGMPAANELINSIQNVRSLFCMYRIAI
jgi:hypothetical protein